MSFRRFFANLLFVSALCLGLGYWLEWLVGTGKATRFQFPARTVLLFWAVSLLLFFLGRYTAAGTKGHAFLGVVLASVFGKMIVSLAYLAWYRNAEQPENASYVGVFLLIYGIFTVYEVRFLTLLGKSTQ